MTQQQKQQEQQQEQKQQEQQIVQHHRLMDTAYLAALMVACFSLPSIAAFFFETNEAEWTQDWVGRIRRQMWPTLKDPDSLLVVQTLLRIPLLLCPVGLTVFYGLRVSFGALAGAALFLCSQIVRIRLFQVPEFRMEGPIGGRFCLAADVLVCLAAAANLAMVPVFARTEARPSRRTVLSALPLAMLLLGVGCIVAKRHYLSIAEAARPDADQLFSLVHAMEALAVPLLLLVGRGRREQKKVPRTSPALQALGKLAFGQAVLGLVYFADLLHLHPYSTMVLGAKLEPRALMIIGAGRPVELLLLCQIVQAGAVLWAGFSKGFLKVALPWLAGATALFAALQTVGPKSLGHTLGTCGMLWVTVQHFRGQILAPAAGGEKKSVYG